MRNHQNPEEQRVTDRTGHYITYGVWILFAVMLTLLFGFLMDRQRNPNQSLETRISVDNVREVVLKRNRIGHYVASGTINGRAVEYLLDTGATHVAIPESLALKLGLTRGKPIPTSTANGVITTYATVLDRVELGGIMLRNVRASINPHTLDDEVLLGMGFLKHLELIQKGDLLMIRQVP